MLTEQRILHNLEVISSFKNNTASADVLKNYSGWGGLRDEIYAPSIYRELKKSLSVEEITSLKQTLKSAYYTPAFLVQFIYDWLSIYGFKGGNILEPAVGHGIFIEHMPKAIREQSTITTVEKDRLTSDIVQTLYPDLNHYTMGFEEYYTQDSFDLIVGNPPYGSQTVEDKHHADLQHYCIHHYFVAKCMRLLNEQGILAMLEIMCAISCIGKGEAYLLPIVCLMIYSQGQRLLLILSSLLKEEKTINGLKPEISRLALWQSR